MIPLARVRAMLELFPLDGLRKAAEKIDSPDIKIPERQTSIIKQHGELVEAFLAGLANDTLGTRVTLTISPDDMWPECHQSGTPVTLTGEAVPVLDDDLKDQIRSKVTEYLRPFDKQSLQGVCAGKVSSQTRTAEESAYKKRWRDRYGKAEFEYTYMRRVYKDNTTSHDYKAREAVALEVEQFVFNVLRTYHRKPLEHLVGFSEETGRTLKSNVDRKPEWGMFVYLVIKE